MRSFSDAIPIVWRRIEVVVTSLTRNQVVRKGTWVRIPPSPPKVHRNFNRITVVFFNGILKDNGSEMAFQRKRIAVFHKSKSGGDTKNENKRNAKRDISKQAE